MIDEDTELINLDEATVGLMDIDDWKIITQGGWTALDRKWKTAKGFLNRAPIFITCQKELDFGSNEDNAAMNNRLNKYLFKPLPIVNKDAAKWIKDHPMDCITWAASQCAGPANQSQEENDETMLECTGLTKEDKEAIIALDLESENTVDNTDAPEHYETQRPTLNSGDDDNDEIIESLNRASEDCTHNVGKARMIKNLIRQRKEEIKESRQRVHDAEVRAHRKRQEALRKIGVDEDLLDLLPMDVDDAVPTQLQQEIDVRRAEEHQLVQEREHARVRNIFRNVWLKCKEKEMVNLQMEIENCPHGNVKKAKEYILTICVDALKAYHTTHKTLAAEISLACQRNTCIELGLLKSSHAHLVSSLHEPLPLDQDKEAGREEKEPGQEEEEEEDDDEIFMTPPYNNNNNKHQEEECRAPSPKKSKRT